MDPLTAEEIADLTPLHGDSVLPPVGRGAWVKLDRASYERIRNALPRLLEEIGRWRNPEAIKMWRDENAATLERARALLKRIEWSGVYDSGYGDRCHPCCPSCRADSPADGGGDGKHAPGCELAALVA